MSLWRCSVCNVVKTEDEFVFAPIDELRETVFCFDCAPPEAMKQQWPIDEEPENEEKTS